MAGFTFRRGQSAAAEPAPALVSATTCAELDIRREWLLARRQDSAILRKDEDGHAYRIVTGKLAGDGRGMSLGRLQGRFVMKRAVPVICVELSTFTRKLANRCFVKFSRGSPSVSATS